MDYLANFLSNEELLEVIMKNPSLKFIEAEDVRILIEFLYNLGCSEKDIAEIIYSNPDFLDLTKEELIKLVDKLRILGLTDYKEMFTSNPWLLTKTPEELDELLVEERKKGTAIVNILDKIEKGYPF